MSRTRFWMVWNPDGRGPRYEHMSRSNADREAQRLARENPGQEFYVLKAVAGFVTQHQPVESIKLRKPQEDDIPF